MSRKFFGWIEKVYSSPEENHNFFKTAADIRKNVRIQETKNAILDACVVYLDDEYYLKWHGPRNLFLIRLALLRYGKKRILIPNFGWLFWEMDMGFFGDGLSFFKKS